MDWCEWGLTIFGTDLMFFFVITWLFTAMLFWFILYIVHILFVNVHKGCLHSVIIIIIKSEQRHDNIIV